MTTVFQKQGHRSYFSLIVRQYRRNVLAVVGFWALIALIVIALAADFIANDKPILIQYEEKLYFPVVHSYLSDLKIVRWPREFRNKKFKLLVEMDARRPEAERKIGFVIFPPIPFSPNSTASLYHPNESVH